MKKQPEATAATRQGLIDAFWTLYERKRIEQIRIKEIADIAGNTRGTFYEYFLDIYDLLSQEEDALIGQIIEAAPKVQSGSMDDAIARIVGIYENNGKRLCALLGEDGDPQFIHKFKNALFPAFRQMRALPDSGRTAIIYEFGINGLIMAFHAWHTSKEQMPAEEFIETARSLIENGVIKTLENG